MFELAIPVGIMVTPDAPTHKVAFAAGFELRVLVPL
jgi:hypothetical protein